MPIGGFVVTAVPNRLPQVKETLQEMRGVSIYGEEPQKGYLIVVLESDTSEEMEKLEQRIQKIEGVLGTHLAYLYYEDELEKIERGEIRPEIPFGKKRRG